MYCVENAVMVKVSHLIVLYEWIILLHSWFVWTNNQSEVFQFTFLGWTFDENNWLKQREGEICTAKVVTISLSGRWPKFTSWSKQQKCNYHQPEGKMHGWVSCWKNKPAEEHQLSVFAGHTIIFICHCQWPCYRQMNGENSDSCFVRAE